MPTPTEQLLSRTVYLTDGSTVNWDFSFASGYINSAHVKAQTKDATGAITQIVVTAGMLIGEFQLRITPALAAGLELTIYRDTPKDAPLVNFMDESGFSETALDVNAKQAVMIAAEAIDTINSSDLNAAISSAETAGNAAAAAAASALAAASSVASIGTSVTQAQAAAAAAAASAASINPAAFATAAQGTKADTALQPAAIGVSIQGYDATTLKSAAIGVTVQPFDGNTAKVNLAQAWTNRQRSAYVTLTDAATITVDLQVGNNYRVTLAGNRTLGAPTNYQEGTSGSIFIKQDATGSRTLAYASAWKFEGGVIPTLTTAANAVDRLDYITEGSTVNAVLTKDVK